MCGKKMINEVGVGWTGYERSEWAMAGMTFGLGIYLSLFLDYLDQPPPPLAMCVDSFPGNTHR